MMLLARPIPCLLVKSIFHGYSAARRHLSSPCSSYTYIRLEGVAFAKVAVVDPVPISVLQKLTKSQHQ